MSTTNLDLETINTSDYVDISVFNNNFKKLDKLGIDYVVEQGVSGEWWYRKWKSGRLECGIDDKEFPTISHNISWGGGYRTDRMNFGSYPFAFSSRPYAKIEFNSNESTTGEWASYIVQISTTSTTRSPDFWLVDNASSTVVKPHFGIFVCGKYTS